MKLHNQYKEFFLTQSQMATVYIPYIYIVYTRVKADPRIPRPLQWAIKVEIITW